MSSQDSPSPKPDGRRPSNTATPALASEDDAAVLGTRSTVSNISDTDDADVSLRSEAWLQARVETQLLYDRGLRHCFQYHGPSAINCLDLGIFNSCRTGGASLGQYGGSPVVKETRLKDV